MSETNIHLKQLLNKFFHDEISSEEFKELKQLADNSADKEVCKMLSEHWDNYNDAEELPTIKKQQLYQSINRRTNIPLRIKLIRNSSRIAAAILFLILGSWIVYLTNDNRQMKVLAEKEIRFTSGKIGRSTVILPDGSSVLLNANSALAYQGDFGKIDRKVSLSGEALFKVKRNEEKEFVVKANSMTIKVLGTTFNVSSYETDDFVEMSLINGSVKVNAECPPYESYLVKPNQKVILDKRSGKMSLHETKAKHEILWASESLVFNETPMREVFNILEKRYDVKFKFENVHFLDDTYSGTFDDNYIENVLFVLQQHYHFEYTQQKNVITIVSFK